MSDDAHSCCLLCTQKWYASRPDETRTWRMTLCKTCGNKRCPKATDHTLACTGSNEPGQAGSAYA